LRLALGVSVQQFEDLDAAVGLEVDDAVEFATNSPEPAVEDWESVVYA
jgi:TPP-dependent pyruvate/acetoin dehydrogenase alpha subunit